MNGRILKDSAMAYWILSINFSEMNENTPIPILILKYTHKYGMNTSNSGTQFLILCSLIVI